MAYTQKNNPFRKSPIKQGYKPPKIKYDNTKKSGYDPETGIINIRGAGLFSSEELYKREAHETKHHHQREVGVDIRKKFFDDREKYIKENLKKHKIKDEDHELDLREDYASRFRSEQYKTPGTTEYEARQAEKKASPGLFRKQ